MNALMMWTAVDRARRLEARAAEARRAAEALAPRRPASHRITVWRAAWSRRAVVPAGATGH